MSKKKLKPQKRANPSPRPDNVRRRELYKTDPAYRRTQQERALWSYRQQKGKELENCLHSLFFLDQLSAREAVVYPNDRRTRVVRCLSLTQTAHAMQKIYQTVWRWVRRGQLPAPVLVTKAREEPRYHIEEVRIFIEEIGAHERMYSYYRTDHAEVRDRIFRRIEEFRKQKGIA